MFSIYKEHNILQKVFFFLTTFHPCLPFKSKDNGLGGNASTQKPEKNPI